MLIVLLVILWGREAEPSQQRHGWLQRQWCGRGEEDRSMMQTTWLAMAARAGEKLRVRAGGLGRPSKTEKDWFFFGAHTPSCLFLPSVISLCLPSLSGNERAMNSSGGINLTKEIREVGPTRFVWPGHTMPTVTHVIAPIVFLIIQFFLNLFIKEILKFKNWYYFRDNI
jgi:hypothetical protein